MSQEITLEKIKLAFQQKFDEDDKERLLNSVSVHVGYVGHDFVRDQFTMQIQGFLWGERVEGQIIEYPADWWQAFKARWFPWFLLRWFPVLWMRYEISLTTLYPDFRISMPDEKHVLKYELRGPNCTHRC